MGRDHELIFFKLLARYFDRLLPYSSYSLFLYNEDQHGKHNPVSRRVEYFHFFFDDYAPNVITEHVSETGLCDSSGSSAAATRADRDVGVAQVGGADQAVVVAAAVSAKRETRVSMKCIFFFKKKVIDR